MSKTKFTEGEWRALEKEYTYPVIYVEEDGEKIAKVFSKCDAHLISQAKNLYDVVEKIARLSRLNDRSVDEYIHNSVLSLEKLLAKCRGE